MARPREDRLTVREAQIMQVIWDCGEASVEQVQTRLPDRLADSTIRTLLQIMANKGYVKFRKQGRAKVYRALEGQEEVQKSAIRQMVALLFGGSAEMLLARMVEDEQVDLKELDRVRRKLRQRKG